MILIVFGCAFLVLVVTMVFKLKTATRGQWRLLLLLSLFTLNVVLAAIVGVLRFRT